MAGLASPPGFGNNSWNEEKWSRAQAIIDPRFVVADAAAWKPSVVTSADRTVAMAPGRGYACGVYDETSTTDSAPQLDPNSSGSNRYDLIVARFNWSTNTRVFAVIKGTTLPPQGNATSTVQATQVNRIPGVQYDGVVALVTVRPNVGTLAASDLLDLRVWTGAGRLVTPDIRALPYLDSRIGDSILAGGDAEPYTRSGFQWRREQTGVRLVADANMGTGKRIFRGETVNPIQSVYGPNSGPAVDVLPGERVQIISSVGCYFAEGGANVEQTLSAIPVLEGGTSSGMTSLWVPTFYDRRVTGPTGRIEMTITLHAMYLTKIGTTSFRYGGAAFGVGTGAPNLIVTSEKTIAIIHP